MDALVVYEPVFGSERTLADAIGEGLTSHLDVRVVDVAAAPRWPTTELLVVGGPNVRFGLSTARAREHIADHAAASAVRIGPGLREWLGTLRRGSASLVAAVYDTRPARSRLGPRLDHAASTITRRLHDRGIGTICTSQHFWVSGRGGPLASGERERAKTWGGELGRAVNRYSASHV